MTLEQFFKENPRAAIAFSGGVDSSYLLWAAGKWGSQVRGYYVSSAFQPRFELEDAMKISRITGVPVTVVPVDVLCREEITENPENRCYFCKKAIFSAIIEAATADGFSLILDGTNASDQVADRPGIRALRELSVRSPLRECGLTKGEIRSLSRQAGLFTWEKPAYACLATRIPTGELITARKLERTQWAESYLFSLGFRDFRVRTMGENAKIQLTAGDFPLALQKREELFRQLKQQYRNVFLDLEVRHEQ